MISEKKSISSNPILLHDPSKKWGLSSDSESESDDSPTEFQMLIGVVRIPKYCVRIRPRILTTDPRPQADAVLDPLSVRESATHFLTHTGLQLQRRVSNPSERGWIT